MKKVYNTLSKLYRRIACLRNNNHTQNDIEKRYPMLLVQFPSQNILTQSPSAAILSSTPIIFTILCGVPDHKNYHETDNFYPYHHYVIYVYGSIIFRSGLAKPRSI